MRLKVIEASGKLGELTEASDELFGRDFNEALVHQVVTAFQANGRSGNRAQKGRSDINKSTRKPWRQKGTGRARAGMASSPLWRGGGRIFPNSPEENFTQKLNRKMYRAGVATILSQLVRDDRLVVIEDFKLEFPRTKLLAEKIKALGFARVMIVADGVDENLYLSARNMPTVLVTDVPRADPVNLMRFPHVILTRSALRKMEEVLV
ncbi:MAG TPA: 50S ribosomal protein L4 [Burkholderiales bacterium]|nr:50S ribosomal protein L4 [Burkholderiales bacterium]